MKVIISIPGRKEIGIKKLIDLLIKKQFDIKSRTGIDLELIDNAQITLEE